MASNTINQIICSGGLFLTKDTKRFLFLLRAQGKTAGTWGLVGGKKEPTDMIPIDILNREIEEEIGNNIVVDKVVPLELFISKDQNFLYNTYILIVKNEFIPNLNSEHTGYAWCSYNNWPKPLHQGVKNSLNNKTIRSKIELILDLI